MMTSFKKRKEILSELGIEHKCNKRGDRPLFLRSMGSGLIFKEAQDAKR
jgi:hypothetical protein